MLNDYYQNVGIKGFFKRYGVVNALRRGSFMANRLHLVQDYEMRKVLWQRKALNKIRKYMKYQNSDPQGLEFPDKEFDNPVWVYWDQGMDNAPDIIKRCYRSLREYSGRQVIALSKENIDKYIRFPSYITEKFENGDIPIAGYTDLMRFALLEHYGGTWADATLFFTEQIPEEIMSCPFFAFQNSMGLLDNPVLYPAWFLHTERHNEAIRGIRNVAYSYWMHEHHVIEYLLPNLIMTEYLHTHPEVEKAIPYLNSDYSEYLVRKLGDDYTPEEFEWIKKLTGIHKLTYKLDDSINREGSIYHHIMTG